MLFWVSVPAWAAQPAPIEAGLSLGGGGLIARDCRAGGCSGATAFGRFSLPNLSLGWRFSERWALQLYLPSGGHVRGGKLRAFESIQPALQLYLSPDIWLRAGFGLGMDFPLLFTATTGFYFGLAGSAAAGLIFWRVDGVDCSLELRALGGYARYEDGLRRDSLAVDLLVGFTFR